MRRVARTALALAPAIGALLIAGAPGAAASSPPATHPAKPPPSSHQPPPPAHDSTVTPLRGAPHAPGNCQTAPPTGNTRLSGEPWAQQALGFSSVWGLTQGQNVTVAVVDSGVDYTSQLAGRVSYIDVTNTGPADCVGHGTAVASIIAASDQRARGVPFYGVAPAARILSIKVNTGENGYSNLLAVGIRDAAAAGAKVINVSIQTPGNTPALRSAVAYALSRNAVVVAAAGNDNPGTNQVGPFYPAAYPGVISVAAVDQSGQVTSYTDTHTPVSVAAPGAAVASDWPTGFNPGNQGTSFATAFVSGEAALVRAAYPSMSAAWVTQRIIATADGTTGAHSGAGMIDPVEAVTAVLPASAASSTARPQRVSVPAVPHTNPLTRTIAVSVIGGAIAAAVLVVIAAMVLPHGRRRGWRPGRIDLNAIGSESAEADSDWGDNPPAGGRHAVSRDTGSAGESGPRSLTPG